jgi:hypothetical protein
MLFSIFKKSFFSSLNSTQIFLNMIIDKYRQIKLDCVEYMIYLN